MTINLSVPLNSLSFGFCGYNILLELFNRGIEVNLFPIGEINISSFDKANLEFQDWLKRSIYYAPLKYKKSNPSLSLWHIAGSEKAVIGSPRALFTFFELDNITDAEQNILNSYDKVFVSSKYTKEVFDKYVDTEIIYCPLGFDSNHFHTTNKKYYNDNRIVFGVFAKLEIGRKQHAKLIQTWAKKYGNNPNYYLHLHTYNTFLSKEQNEQLLNQILGGQRVWNIISYPYVENLSTLNECYNACHIVLDMSGGEGFSLGSFHCLGLGKHSVIHNCSSMSDWANNENSVLVEPSGMAEVYDNIHFHKGGLYNQGSVYTWNQNDFEQALDKSVKNYLSNPINHQGLKIKEKYTFTKTLDIILKNL